MCPACPPLVPCSLPIPLESSPCGSGAPRDERTGAAVVARGRVVVGEVHDHPGDDRLLAEPGVQLTRDPPLLPQVALDLLEAADPDHERERPLGIRRPPGEPAPHVTSVRAPQHHSTRIPAATPRAMSPMAGAIRQRTRPRGPRTGPVGSSHGIERVRRWGRSPPVRGGRNPEHRGMRERGRRGSAAGTATGAAMEAIDRDAGSSEHERADRVRHALLATSLAVGPALTAIAYMIAPKVDWGTPGRWSRPQGQRHPCGRCRTSWRCSASC